MAAAAAVSAAASKPGSSGSTAAAAATAAINRAEGHGQVGSVGVSTQIVRALQLAARQLRARRAHATRRAAPLVVPASCASSVAMGGAMGGSSYSGSYSGGSLNATAHPPSSLPSFPCGPSGSGPSLGVGVGMGHSALEHAQLRQSSAQTGVTHHASTAPLGSYRQGALREAPPAPVGASAAPYMEGPAGGRPSGGLQPSARAYVPPPPEWGSLGGSGGGSSGSFGRPAPPAQHGGHASHASHVGASWARSSGEGPPQGGMQEGRAPVVTRAVRGVSLMGDLEDDDAASPW